MRERKETVFVAMSGGVDSSVAALLLKERGYDIVGVFMRCYNLDGCAERDAEDAERVASKLGIPFYVWDFEVDYKKRVVEYMIEGYRQGITPNPDVMCNKEIKFGLFYDRARSLGAVYVATGHYVKKKTTPSNTQYSILNSLHSARDSAKDQSYFLWTLTEEKLAHCLFPIGNYLKSEVREIARKGGLPTAEKKDSQGICFLGKVTLADFLKEYIPEERGMVIDSRGVHVGHHNGAWFYTIGQRHGIGNIRHEKGNMIHAPVYVAEKDVQRNTVIVAGEQDAALYRRELELTGVNFIRPLASPIRANWRMDVFARVRYRQPLARAKLEASNLEPRTSNIFSLKFNEPQKFVAPGQSAVFCSKEGEVLGGGVIR